MSTQNVYPIEGPPPAYPMAPCFTNDVTGIHYSPFGMEAVKRRDDGTYIYLYAIPDGPDAINEVDYKELLPNVIDMGGVDSAVGRAMATDQWIQAEQRKARTFGTLHNVMSTDRTAWEDFVWEHGCDFPPPVVTNLDENMLMATAALLPKDGEELVSCFCWHHVAMLGESSNQRSLVDDDQLFLLGIPTVAYDDVYVPKNWHELANGQPKQQSQSRHLER